MRTTIRLNDDLLDQAKQAAMTSGRTLTAIIEDALRQTLSRKYLAPKNQKISLISSGAGGLCPGVDIDRTAELLDIMDESDATS
jgi:hypothetical protein